MYIYKKLIIMKKSLLAILIATALFSSCTKPGDQDLDEKITVRVINLVPGMYVTLDKKGIGHKERNFKYWDFSKECPNYMGTPNEEVEVSREFWIFKQYGK